MLGNTPLVSIIVPVYNAEKYLHYCVDSIIGQSYTNLEILLIDDGATDQSPRICDEYANQDQRITVIHQTNGGIGKAQNTGLDHAHGDYIAFADNDDILDKHNIEYLLHAILQTGADMSKARWRQFGVSQLDDIIEDAKEGAPQPDSITLFKHPLHAYQTVFCKTLRLAGDILGQHTEAKYFNEANWCRLYKRNLFDHIRFPRGGSYAQDVFIAGQLYEHMGLVADLNVVLYNWLQSSGSVTHSQKSYRYYHDNFMAGLSNFNINRMLGVTPMRSYYTLIGSFEEQKTAKDYDLPENRERHEMDRILLDQLLGSLTPVQRITCSVTRRIRLLEKRVYDARVKNMK